MTHLSVSPRYTVPRRIRLWFSFAALALLSWPLTHRPGPFAIPSGTEIGDLTKLPGYITTGLWWGSLLSAVLCLLLAAKASIWSPSPEQDADRHNSHVSAPRLPRGVFAIALLASLVACFLAWPRLTHSLWNDEAYCLRHYTHGTWQLDAKAHGFRFVPRDWTATIWRMKAANNHMLYSMCSRASLDIHRHLTPKASRHWFSEISLRLPAYAAGAAVAFVVIVLAARLSTRPLATACVAAALVTSHPFLTQYMAEARGYTLAALLLFLALASAARMQPTRPHMHITFAILQFLSILAYTGLIVFWAVFNLFLLFFALRSHGVRSQEFHRIVAACALAAAMSFQWLAPVLPQIAHYLKLERPPGPLNLLWAIDTLSHFFIGRPLKNPSFDLQMRPTLNDLIVDAPFLAFLWMTLALAAGTAGVWQLLRFRSAAARALLCALALSPVLLTARGIIAEDYIYPWYFSALIPVCIVIASIGAAKWITRSKPWSFPIGIAAAVGLCLANVAINAPLIELMRAQPRQDLREAAARSSPFTPQQRPHLRFSIGKGAIQLATYRPDFFYALNHSELERLVSWANAHGASFSIAVGGLEYLRAMQRDDYLYLTAGEKFKPFATIAGWDGFYTFTLFTSKPIP